jgi:hypothetical protein
MYKSYNSVIWLEVNWEVAMDSCAKAARMNVIIVMVTMVVFLNSPIKVKGALELLSTRLMDTTEALSRLPYTI